VVRYFDDTQKGHWARLVQVLVHTARTHCPGWTLDVADTGPSEIYSPTGRQPDADNTRKMDAWAAAVAAASDGDRLLLIDGDTIIRRPLDDVWTRRFDLAYTRKPEEARYPFNGGVIFLRVSDRTRRFMQMWRDVNRFLLEHPQEHDVWRPAYGGMNQSALGMLFTQPDQAWPAQFKGYRHELDVLRLPCLEWNCEDEHWDVFDPSVTRIVHYKSGLQRATLLREDVSRAHSTLVSEWRALEDEAKRTTMISQAPQNMQVTSDELTNPERAAEITVPEDNAPPPLTRQQRRRLQRKGAV